MPPSAGLHPSIRPTQDESSGSLEKRFSYPCEGSEPSQGCSCGLPFRKGCADESRGGRGRAGLAGWRESRTGCQPVLQTTLVERGHPFLGGLMGLCPVARELIPALMPGTPSRTSTVHSAANGGVVVGAGHALPLPLNAAGSTIPPSGGLHPAIRPILRQAQDGAQDESSGRARVVLLGLARLP